MDFMKLYTCLLLILIFNTLLSKLSAQSISCSNGTFNNGTSCIACGRTFTSSFRIVGGINAINGSTPYQVLITATSNRQTILCGGTLISRKTVLTAAHCLTSTSASAYKIYLGAYKLSKEGATLVNVDRVIKHENFRSDTLVNDIGLIILKDNITLGSKIWPACLPDFSWNYATYGRTAIASGWGLTKYNGQAASVLQSVNLTIYNPTKSCTFYVGVSWSNKICAGTSSMNSCSGDSGGGLLVYETVNGTTKPFVAGVTSSGYQCSKPSIYTRVSAFRYWIDGKIVY